MPIKNSSKINKLKRASENVPSLYEASKNYLSVSYNDSLIGRDEEYGQIYKIIKNSLEISVSSALYISGPAGTGKTLTVNTVVDDLKHDYKFTFINLNCMSVQNSIDFLNKFIKVLDPKQFQKKTFHDESEVFTEIKSILTQSKKMVLFMLDEIDQLKAKNYEFLNSIFKLPRTIPNKIVLIGIANALDLTTKLFRSKDSKTHIQEIRFLPYQKDQIVHIIENRLKLATSEENIIDKSAIEFCARKIASCSGDIRKALDVCRRAIELVENHSQSLNIKSSPLKLRQYQSSVVSTQVNINLMMNVLNKVYGTSIEKIEHETKVFLPADQQVIICTLLILLKTKSTHEVTLHECRQLLNKICQKNAISSEGKSDCDILNMCQFLADYGYVMVNKKDSTAKVSNSPFKRTPKKNPTVHLSLLIDPYEAEQLLSSFHKSIVMNFESYF